MHHGVRGWPLRVLIHFPVLQSTIRTVWSPWEDAILVLELRTIKIKVNQVIFKSRSMILDKFFFALLNRAFSHHVVFVLKCQVFLLHVENKTLVNSSACKYPLGNKPHSENFKNCNVILFSPWKILAKSINQL